MLDWIMDCHLNSFERSLGTSVDYLCRRARTSIFAFFKSSGFVPIAARHGGTPRRMLFAARFLATQREDCGACVQIVVNQATRDWVRVEIIEAMLPEWPHPELGIANWTHWRTHAVAAVTTVIDLGQEGGST